MRRLVLVLAGVALAASGAAAYAQRSDPAPLQLEAKIPLGNVRGRLDHFALDPHRHHLFLAELENNTVGVIDLNQRKTVHTIAGLQEPQGVGYVPSTDTVYVANGSDGSVRVFRAEDYAPLASIGLGSDADNIRLDADRNVVVVGYGEGALATIDPISRTKTVDIPLSAHPEGFQISTRSNRIFVNLPKARVIAVLDRLTGQPVATWPAPYGGNFPMTLDEENGRVIVIFRSPAKLAVFAQDNGKLVAERDVCGDSDDVFFDAKRRRIYVSCGAGFIDVLSTEGDAYKPIARIPTVAGARTSFFMPALDRFALGVRKSEKEPAAVWLYRAVPQ